jgi:hypothetical protein
LVGFPLAVDLQAPAGFPRCHGKFTLRKLARIAIGGIDPAQERFVIDREIPRNSRHPPGGRPPVNAGKIPQYRPIAGWLTHGIGHAAAIGLKVKCNIEPAISTKIPRHRTIHVASPSTPDTTCIPAVKKISTNNWNYS